MKISFEVTGFSDLDLQRKAKEIAEQFFTQAGNQKILIEFENVRAQLQTVDGSLRMWEASVEAHLVGNKNVAIAPPGWPEMPPS